MTRYILICFLILINLYIPAQAQQSQKNSDLPLEVTAQQNLEWNRDKRQYIARGNAIAKQGNMQISGDTLIAQYDETKDDSGAGKITKLFAQGHVVITSEQSTATGENAQYDVINGQAIMTGSNLMMTSKDQTVTAKDRFEYWVEEGRLSAYGDAVVVRGDDTIKADDISAWFVPQEKDGPRVMDRAEANGHVIITTPSDKATGNKGTYSRATNIAELLGNVKIENGQNYLEGDRAEINLETNVSKMFAEKTADGRVKGIFYPGSSKKPATIP